MSQVVKVVTIGAERTVLDPDFVKICGEVRKKVRGEWSRQSLVISAVPVMPGSHKGPCIAVTGPCHEVKLADVTLGGLQQV